MKIIQIVAAYKPAYIYGGPTMSVAKLCEKLVEHADLITTTSITTTTTTLALASTYLNLQVFTTTANGKTELNVAPNQTTLVDGVKVTYFKRLTKDHTHFSPALLWSLRKEIKKSKTKQPTNQQTNQLIIHIHAWWNLVSIFSCAIAKWYNIPVALTPRGMLTAYTSTNRNSIAKIIIHKLLGKKLLQYCHIHVTSEKEKRDVLAMITPKSITVIPNLVQLGDEKSYNEETNYNLSVQSPNLCYQTRSEKTQSSQGIIETSDEQRTTINELSEQSPNLCYQTRSEKVQSSKGIIETKNELLPFKLIFLSRIEQKKGLEILFEALSKLSINWNLTIAGPGEYKYIESLRLKVESLKIGDHIHWIGQVKNEVKFNLLAEHNLMVLTSYNENFANVVVECLSMGTPVLLSNEVGLADYVEHNKLGWITDLNPDTIKSQLLLAYESKDVRETIRKSAPNIIIKDFDSENLIEKYFTLYSNIINGRL